jgi:curved DNA-binding protein CbpA
MRCAELVVKHHPDKNGGAASEHFLGLVEAWRTLGSPAARRRYDAQRANARLTARQATPAILCCSFMMNENIFLLTF